MRGILLPVYQKYPGALLVHGKQVAWDPARREWYGADYLADRLWVQFGGQTPERHPADWKRYHRAAGMIRNAEMADLGALFTIAVLVDGLPCKGTRDMIKQCEARGIPVREHTYRRTPVPVRGAGHLSS